MAATLQRKSSGGIFCNNYKDYYKRNCSKELFCNNFGQDGSTQRTQRLNIFKTFVWDCNFQARIFNETFDREWNFQASHTARALIVENSRVEIENFKREWSFQARMKLSCENLKISSDQARMKKFKIWVLRVRKRAAPREGSESSENCCGSKFWQTRFSSVGVSIPWRP